MQRPYRKSDALGAALIHHKKGDVIAVRAERGVQGYRIMEIQ